MSFSKFDYMQQNVLDAIEEYVRKHILSDLETRGKLSKKKRSRGNRVDYHSTTWWRMISDPLVSDETSKIGGLFRLRFRTPFALFRDILMPLMRNAVIPIFPEEDDHRVRVPIELKVMVALRILGRGNCLDDIYEMSGVPSSSISTILHQFVYGMVANYFTDYVHMPVDERLFNVMEMYAMLGFPGAAGSMDATHLRLGKCPAALAALCQGKEPFPTLGFMCVVDHSKMINYASDAYYGLLMTRVFATSTNS